MFLHERGMQGDLSEDDEMSMARCDVWSTWKNEGKILFDCSCHL
jgi:hypothetical protein